jgi:hypothetical protein
MAFAKRRVSLIPLMVAHERETGLFQAEYAAENRYKNAEETRILSLYHDKARREQREALSKVTDELNATFERGDLIRVVSCTHHVFEEIMVFERVESWWLHDSHGSGSPMVSMLYVEDANERYIRDGS